MEAKPRRSLDLGQQDEQILIGSPCLMSAAEIDLIVFFLLATLRDETPAPAPPATPIGSVKLVSRPPRLLSLGVKTLGSVKANAANQIKSETGENV